MGGSGLGESSFSWTRCSIRPATFDAKVDAGCASVMADAGRFGNKLGVWGVSSPGAPLLNGADLRSSLARGLAAEEPRGFEFLWQGLELTFGLFDQDFDLVSPGLLIVEGVDHLLEREGELRIGRRVLFIARGGLSFGAAVNIGLGEAGGPRVFIEPR